MLLLPFGEVHQQQVQIFNLSKNIAHIYCLCLPKVIMHREERLRVLERDLTSLCIAEERTPTTTEGTLPPIQGGVEARAIVEKIPKISVQGRKAAAAEEKRKKLAWQTAMYEASLQNGFLRLCWDETLQLVSPVIYDFHQSFGLPMKALRLIGIGLTELPLDFAPNLISLEILSLANNKLVTLPDNLVALTNLKELNLMYNKINRLPERIGFMCSLVKLGISNNCLEVLPITFGALNLMERVDLEHNALAVLPENLDNMLSCRAFNVNNNKLARLPRCVGHMPSLTSFSASCNALTYIPSQFTLSPTLTCLRLNVNQITHLPDRFGDLTQLVELDLDYNKISKLPHTFWRLSSLRVLRMEGNVTMLDPPPEVMGQGGPAVVAYLKAIYLNDKVARMREVVLATQNVLKQIQERDFADSAYFEPDYQRTDKDLDRWFALQLPYLWKDLLPQLKRTWESERAAMGHHRRHKHAAASDDLTSFDYSEQEVMHALTNYSDAVGPVLRMQKAMFRRCACLDSEMKRRPCVPPAPGYMCLRDCVLLKKELVRERDKHDRMWQAYKSDGMRDAMKRADYEAKLYLDSAEGQLWLENTAYEQAEEVLLDSGANVVIEKRFQGVENKKKKVVARYDQKKLKVQKVRDRKIQQVESQLETLKEDRRLAKEGYVRNAVEQRIQSLTVQLAHLPETTELQQLQNDCERDCSLLDEGLFDSDSVNTSEVDSSEFSSENDSPEAAKWRERLQRRNEAIEERDKLRQIKKRFDVKVEAGKSTNLTQAKLLLDTYLVQPLVAPVTTEASRQANKLRKKIRRSVRQAVEVATIRTRKLYLKFNGHFDEVQRELKYEIYRQYVDHHVAEAKEKAKHEFAVIESVRTNMAGMGRDKAFRAWKFWVVTKKRRLRKDLRKQWKMATRGFDAAMQSVTSAQFQVDLWIKKKDIYSDKIYWRNDIDGKITFDRPGLHHYLPPNFKIPEPPADLPADIPLMTSSSEDSQDDGWMLRYEERRRKKKEDQTLLQLALHSRGKSDKDGDSDSDSSSSSDTDSRTAMTAPSAAGESVGSIQQFLRASRESIVAASSLSRPSASQEEAGSIGFDSASASAPLGSSVLLGGDKSEGRVGGQKFSAKAKTGNSSSSSGSGSGSGDSSDSESESNATSRKASGSRSGAAGSESKATSARGGSSVSRSVGNVSERSSRTQLLDGVGGIGGEGNNLGSALELSQSVVTYSDGNIAGAAGQDPSSSQEQTDQNSFDQGQVQLFDSNERYTEYWDENLQMILYWDNVDQNYQYWDEVQQQYLVCDYSQAMVPAVLTEGDESGQVASALNSTSEPLPLVLTGRSEQYLPLPPTASSAMVTAVQPPRYDFRRKMAELSTMYDENEEEYVGAAHSIASKKLQDAVNLAKDYMQRNSLYLQRQQLLAIGGGQLKNQSSKRRKSSAIDKKALAHQVIDLYAKPSNLDEEAAIVKQKAFQEYELAFKSIRKRRNQLNPERHHTYMRQVNRKPKSLEMILAEQAAAREASATQLGSDEQILQQLMQFTTSDAKGDGEFRSPTKDELLKLAGGELDMVHTGKPGMDLRTVLAQRALVLKRKLEKKAVEQHLMVAKKSSTFWGREIRPLFMSKYQGSSSEEDDADEETKLKRGKEVRKKLRRERRADKNFMAQKIGSPAGK